MERINNRGIQSKSLFTTNLKIHLNKVEELFKSKPIIYSNFASIQELTTEPSWLSDYLLFVASYGRTTPYLPTPWKTWRFWQFTSAYAVPGLTRGYDADYFNGTLDELNKIFGMVKETVQILTLEERVASLEQRVLDLERG